MFNFSKNAYTKFSAAGSDFTHAASHTGNAVGSGFTFAISAAALATIGYGIVKIGATASAIAYTTTHNFAALLGTPTIVVSKLAEAALPTFAFLASFTGEQFSNAISEGYSAAKESVNGFYHLGEGVYSALTETDNSNLLDSKDYNADNSETSTSGETDSQSEVAFEV